MEENNRIVIEDSFDFERNATIVVSLIFIGIMIGGGIYWVIIYPLLVKLLTAILFPIVCYVIWYIFKRIRNTLKDCSFILSENGFEINGSDKNYVFLWKELINIRVVRADITYRDPDTSNTIRYNVEISDRLETHLIELKDNNFHIEKIRLFLNHLKVYASQMGISFKTA